MYGNCLCYAVARWLLAGGRGRIRFVPYRFLYTGTDGVTTYFGPRHPKRGWRAVLHSLFFKGQVKKCIVIERSC
jgi:hypothetical protein